jgi:hypothetical protein
VPSLIYNSALNDALNGNIDFGSDAFKVMLVTSAYTPNKDAHTKRSDVTDEVAASGSYAAGGGAVTVSVTNDTANDRQDVSLGGASFTAATITARGAVYYKARGGLASADELVAYIDFGSNVTSTAGTFDLTASTIRLNNP